MFSLPRQDLIFSELAKYRSLSSPVVFVAIERGRCFLKVKQEYESIHGQRKGFMKWASAMFRTPYRTLSHYARITRAYDEGRLIGCTSLTEAYSNVELDQRRFRGTENQKKLKKILNVCGLPVCFKSINTVDDLAVQMKVSLYHIRKRFAELMKRLGLSQCQGATPAQILFTIKELLYAQG